MRRVLLLLLVAACSGKSSAGGGAAAVPGGPELVATPLDPAGPAWAGLTIDVPPGTKVLPMDNAPAAKIVCPGGPNLQILSGPPAIAASKKQYETFAVYKRAQVTFQVATDDTLEYTIQAGPQKEQGFENRVTLGGTTFSCLTLESTSNPTVLDVARAACKSLKKK